MTTRIVAVASLLVIGIAMSVVPASAQRRSRLSLDSEPVLVVGTMDGPEEFIFQFLSHARVLPSRNILVADRISGELRIFSMTGELIRSFGGQGEGPAEFRHIGGISLRMDTIVVIDPMLGKQAYFSLDGELLGTDRLEQFGATLIGIGEDGRRWWSWFAGVVDGPTQRLTADSIAIGVTGVDHTGVRSVSGTIAGWRFDRRPHPFSPVTRPVLFRDSVLIADPMTGRIAVLDIAGRPARFIDVRLPQVDNADAWRLLEEQVRTRPDLRSMQDVEIPRIDRLPRMAAILVDGSDRIWVKQYDPSEDAHWLGGWAGGEGGEWLVVDADGSVVSSIAVPSRAVPLHIGANVLMARLRDEWDVQYLAVYRLHESR
jgi:hypothetical protein